MGPRAVPLSTLLAAMLVLAACASATSDAAGVEPVQVASSRPPAPAGGSTGASVSGMEPVAMCDVSLPQSHPPIAHSYALTYGKADGRSLLLDLAVPTTPGPHPLVVLFHGGGFRHGHRSSGRLAMEMLAARGYAAASVGYRLMRTARGRPPTGRFPAPVADARCAVRWLRFHAGELGIDPERVAAVGFSAGAHLAQMLGTASDVAALDEQCAIPEVSPRVSAAVSFYGPSDFRPGLRVGNGADGVVARFLGVSRELDPARAALASPAAHVDPADPPMLLVHGARDHVVSVDQSRHMERTLRAAGVPAVYVELPGSAHGFGMFPPGTYSERATCTALEFLRRAIGP